MNSNDYLFEHISDNPKESRTRSWAAILYPESMSADAFEKIEQLHVPCCLSPLHDKDEITQSFSYKLTDEELSKLGTKYKKEHYHLITAYDSVKSYTQAKNFFLSIGAVGCEPVRSLVSYTRYLTHADNPDKFQYNSFDVKTFNGFDYSGIILKKDDDLKILMEMQDFVMKNNIRYIHELVVYSSVNNFSWYAILHKRGMYPMNEFIKSYNRMCREKNI